MALIRGAYPAWVHSKWSERFIQDLSRLFWRSPNVLLHAGVNSCSPNSEHHTSPQQITKQWHLAGLKQWRTKELLPMLGRRFFHKFRAWRNASWTELSQLGLRRTARRRRQGSIDVLAAVCLTRRHFCSTPLIATFGCPSERWVRAQYNIQLFNA